MPASPPLTDIAPARLLLVDDEASLREPLASYLERQGFVLRAAASAAEARMLLAGDGVLPDGAGGATAERTTAAPWAPDLVLLDIMMPGEDGLSLCRYLAARAVPVILLTARGEADDRIAGLEIGADDYVVKPFEPRELVARIRSVLRRATRNGAASVPPEEDFTFEGWRLDPLRRRLVDPEGAVVAISSVEFRLLLAFLEHPRQVLDRDRLLDMVQGREAHLFDRAVDNQVSRLRRKIEADSRNPQLIQTVWGGGYMLAADVRRLAGQGE